MHEQTIPDLLRQLAWSIRAEGHLRHPIIADKRSFVVLDGMHRVAALQRLGIKRVPVCMVDYESPAVKVCSWYRTINGADVIEHIQTQVEQAGSSMKRIKRIDDRNIGVSPVVAAIKTENEVFSVRSPFATLKEAYDIIESIEERMKANGLEVHYETELDASKKLRSHEADAILYTPKLSKREIVVTATSGQLFAYKATRHVIPARPLSLSVPLSLLRGSEKSLREVNDMLTAILQKRQLKRIAAGSVFEGRRYEEELYVFEEKP